MDHGNEDNQRDGRNDEKRNQEHSNQEQETRAGKISRRAMLASLGLTGTAVVSGGLLYRLGSTAGDDHDKDSGQQSEVPDMERVRDDLNGRGINAVFPPEPLKGMSAEVENNSPLLQQIIHYARENGIRKIVIPSGTYRVLNTIIVPSHIQIVGEGIVNFDLGGKVMERVIQIWGTIENEIPTQSDMTIGDTEVAIGTGNQLEAGDYVMLKSQRTALGPDASPYFRLGTSTATTKPCYFGEFKYIRQIREESGQRILTFSSGPTFPDYRKDNRAETDSHARASTTLQRVRFVEDVTVENIRFINGSVGVSQTQGIIHVRYGLNIQLRNCIYESIKDGAFVRFLESLHCEADGLRTVYRSFDWLANGDHFYQNAYLAVSSTLCGFRRCVSVNGAQPFDLTFSSSSIPSIGCYVIDCETHNSGYNSATTHPGTFQCDISHNRFLHVDVRGLYSGRSTNCSNNLIQGDLQAGLGATYGIALAEGWGRNTSIIGNNITGFYAAVSLHESVSATRDVSYKDSADAIISGNSMSLITTMLRIGLTANNPTELIQLNIAFTNNVGSNFVRLQQSSPYVIEMTGGDKRAFGSLLVHDNVVDAMSYRSDDPANIPQYVVRSRAGIHSLSLKNNVIKNMRTDGAVMLVDNDIPASVELSGNTFTDVEGNPIPLKFNTQTRTVFNRTQQGASGDRPVYPTSGQMFFDHTIGRPIWCRSEAEVDSKGALVSAAVWVDHAGSKV